MRSERGRHAGPTSRGPAVFGAAARALEPARAATEAEGFLDLSLDDLRRSGTSPRLFCRPRLPRYPARPSSQDDLRRALIACACLSWWSETAARLRPFRCQSFRPPELIEVLCRIRFLNRISQALGPGPHPSPPRPLILARKAPAPSSSVRIGPKRFRPQIPPSSVSELCQAHRCCRFPQETWCG